MKRLNDKVAIVTGGGGGIGRATVTRYVEEGAQVIIADIDEAAGNITADVANNAAGNSGGKAVFVRTDVTNDESVSSAVAAAIKNFGKLDILHNNAGGSTGDMGALAEAGEPSVSKRQNNVVGFL